MVKIYDAKLTAVQQAAQAGLDEAAKQVLAVAKTLAPVDTGALRRSGKVKSSWLETAVVFTAPHAVLQHERLDYKHPGGGQAKYLEAAVEQVDVGAVVAGAVKAKLR